MWCGAVAHCVDAGACVCGSSLSAHQSAEDPAPRGAWATLRREHLGSPEGRSFPGAAQWRQVPTRLAWGSRIVDRPHGLLVPQASARLSLISVLGLEYDGHIDFKATSVWP